MSPVMCSSLVPAYSVGLGWCRVTSQVCLRPFLAGGVLLGHVLGDGVGDGAVEEGDPDGVQPRGEDPVDVGGGLHGRGRGSSGRPGGPARPAPPGSGRGARCAGAGGPGRGRRRAGSWRCRWRRRGRGRGVRVRTRPPAGCPRRRGTRRRPGRRRRPRPRRRCRRWRGAGRTTGRRAGAGRGRLRGGRRSLSRRAASSASGPRSSTPDRLVAVLLMGLLKHSPPTLEGAQNPLSTRGSKKFLGVPQPQRSTPNHRAPNGSDECQLEPKRRVTTSLENQDLDHDDAAACGAWVVVSTRLLRNLLDQRRSARPARPHLRPRTGRNLLDHEGPGCATCSTTRVSADEGAARAREVARAG